MALRTVLISGASSDIGLAVCRRYLAADWRVIAHFRTHRAELNALVGPRLETWQADFANTDSLQQRLDEQNSRLQEADAFINLAASVVPTRFEDATAQAVLAMLAINLVPGLLIMQALAPAMLSRKWGRIVHASSIGVKFGGGSDSFLYSLSKHAQEFIPRASRGWSAQGVLVNVVRVGVTDTRAHRVFPEKRLEDRVALIPAGRAAMPDEIADIFFWLGSQQNANISGEIISAAGGE
jgi:3-oxoacyl-[acyl-carrier protein] reductase